MDSMTTAQSEYLHASDIRGMAQLATEATSGVVSMAEGVHQSVLSTLGIPPGNTPEQTGGITGLLYESIRGVTRLLGKKLDRALARLQPVLESAEQAPQGSRQREAVLAVLNGLMGDSLASTDNPLATPMTFHYLDEAPKPTGKVLLLIHGLCMNDLEWHGEVVDHGAALALALGYAPIYLRYNSGLHTSKNGRQLASMLEGLVAQWPTPIEELSVVAHSMGGLVARSAVYYARQEALSWPGRLKSIVFLGTPHHGAPLERAGNWVDVLMGRSPYTAPFSKLGHVRSAGITDLRYGFVVDEDWRGQDRFRRRRDSRQLVPLPDGVACYAVAATLSNEPDGLIGDGLVPVASALGQHDEARRTLAFSEGSKWIAYGMNHLQLLSSPEVTLRLQRWLAQPSFASDCLGAAFEGQGFLARQPEDGPGPASSRS